MAQDQMNPSKINGFITGKLISSHLWLADSGASTHMTNSEKGIYNVRLTETKITIGNGKHLLSHKIGDLRMSYAVKGETYTLVVQNVKYVPQLYVNLLSIPTALNSRFNLTNDGCILILRKGPYQLKFDQLYQNGSSSVCGILMHPITSETAYPALTAET
jgi:hypothetical protein